MQPHGEKPSVAIPPPASGRFTYFRSHEHSFCSHFLRRSARPRFVGLPEVRSSRFRDSDNPPPAPKIEPYKTHLA